MASIASDLVVAGAVKAHRLDLDTPFALWRIDLTYPLGEPDLATLSPAERSRAARFRNPRDARRYTAAHVALRHILEEYSGIAAAAQRFAHNDQGKPSLENDPNWQFNMSYAGDDALIALDFDRPLGIDIEIDRPLADVAELAVLHLAKSEREALSRCRIADWSRAFLGAWTRKEACLKAWGTGLQMAPQNVESGLGPMTMTIALGDTPPVTVGSFRLDGGLIGAWAYL